MLGKEFGHYRILEKLGEGGMGVVYKAEDFKLKRTVALKVLPRHLSSHVEEQARFLQEAQAAAVLNHPHICTIYDVIEAGGEQCIVMEYVDGTTLRDTLSHGPLSQKESVTIAIQIAEALQEAHASGIIHRDVKSANIMLNSKHQAKVMDFGLARLKGSLHESTRSSTAGTLTYMAPEQIQGRGADVRSDIFSFGVVLYEMLTGRYPFRGEHDAAVIYSILNEAPEPMEARSPDIAPELVHIVNRALEKDPEDRYQTVHDMLIDLRRLQRDSGRVQLPPAPPGVGSRRPALAHGVRAFWHRRRLVVAAVLAAVAFGLALVLLAPWKESGSPAQPAHRTKLMILAFRNLGVPADEYFAEGLTQELQNRLTPVHGIALISRMTADQYKGTQKSTPQIAQECGGVDYLLQGSVQWAHAPTGPGQVRVSVQLIRTADDIQSWSETYERDLTGVFDLQKDIAQSIVRQLDVTIVERERQLMWENPTQDQEAYQLWLKGEAAYARGIRLASRPAYDSAIAFYRQATDRDSLFALAYASEAFTHSWLYHTGERIPERLDAARRAMERAVSLQPENPWVRVVHAYYYYRLFRDYDRTLEECDAVQQALPNTVLNLPAWVDRRRGNFPQAIARLKKAHELDPRDAETATEIGTSYRYLRAYDSALVWHERALTIAPDYADALDGKGWTLLLATGDAREAQAVVRLAESKGLEVWLQKILCAEIARDYATCLAILDTLQLEIQYFDAFLIQRELSRAREYFLTGNSQLSRQFAARALASLAAEADRSPSDPRVHAALGYAYAFSGDRARAIREGKHAVELCPVTTDAMIGSTLLASYAEIAAISGDEEQALNTLETLLSMPAGDDISVPLLKVAPVWDNLRKNPRFMKLLSR